MASRDFAPLLEALLDELAERVAERIAARTAPAPPPAPRLVRPAELADQLGVSIDTIDRMRREGMPAARVRGQWRFDPIECRAWFARVEVNRAAPPEAEKLAGVVPLSRPRARKAIGR